MFRRIIAAFLAATFCMAVAHVGIAAALGPRDPVSQVVAVPGSTTGGGMLFEWTAGRNSTCSLSRSLANDSGISVDLKVLNSAGATVARFDVAPGEFFFFEVPANQVTVPMSVQLNGGPVVELLQVGPLAPCEEEPTTTTAPTTTTTEPTTTTAPTTTTTAPTTTTTSPTTTTTAPTTTTTARTTTTSTTRPPTTLSPITIAPTTTAVGGVDIKPAPKTLPVTGRTSRTLVVLAIGLLAGGLAYRVAGPKRYTVRRGR